MHKYPNEKSKSKYVTKKFKKIVISRKNFTPKSKKFHWEIQNISPRNPKHFTVKSKKKSQEIQQISCFFENQIRLVCVCIRWG